MNLLLYLDAKLNAHTRSLIAPSSIQVHISTILDSICPLQPSNHQQLTSTTHQNKHTNSKRHSITTQSLTKPKTRVGNISPEIPKLVGIDHQALKRTRSSPNS
ncbi:hypothetical protein PIB30_045802 [Stylosanthes scabra]|uniref:Uncharacterized protein n=1 Tax=Stylosanthes scabra TaxID=79078 RepID=A0ABU6ZF02_9FABA|nr:hypothetical protein [Stylosanthes scabra]